LVFVNSLGGKYMALVLDVLSSLPMCMIRLGCQCA
jgi:hypothetical protein